MLQKVFDALQLNKLDEAELLLKEIIRLDSNNPDALHLMGIVCGMQGRPEDALLLLNQCLEITPDNPLLHFNIAKAFSSLQKDQEAIKHHLKAVELV